MMARLVVTAIVMALTAATLFAQGRFRGRPAPVLATAESHDGAFHYCRLMYRSSRYGSGGGWMTDYPDADFNMSIRLSELTKLTVSKTDAGVPRPLVVRITDDELFQCPFIMAQEVGSIYIGDDEAAKLREYLLKGGFLWVDDFWGSYAWEHWAGEISKVLPPAQFPNIDLEKTHPMFRTVFELRNGVPQVPSINHWYASGGGTSERGADGAQVHARGIFDAAGRLMVLQTHNTDISDSWEREGESHDYFLAFSVEGYALAVNVLAYVTTH
jgi:hypothetical protein